MKLCEFPHAKCPQGKKRESLCEELAVCKAELPTDLRMMVMKRIKRKK